MGREGSATGLFGPPRLKKNVWIQEKESRVNMMRPRLVIENLTMTIDCRNHMSGGRLEFVTEREIIIVWVFSVIVWLGWLGCRGSSMLHRRCRARAMDRGRGRGRGIMSIMCNFSGDWGFIWDDGGRRGFPIRAIRDSDTAWRNRRHLYLI